MVHYMPDGGLLELRLLVQPVRQELQPWKAKGRHKGGNNYDNGKHFKGDGKNNYKGKQKAKGNHYKGKQKGIRSVKEDDQNYDEEEWQDDNYQEVYDERYDPDYHPEAPSSSSTGAPSTSASSRTPVTNHLSWSLNELRTEPPVGLQSSLFIQRVEMDFSIASMQTDKYYTCNSSKHDYLMIDPGAHACVCSPDYFPDIAVVPLMPEHLPQLRTVTGDCMKCHGVKYVDYVLSPKHRMTVRYYVL